MHSFWIIFPGFLAAAAALTLARLEYALTSGESRVENPMGDVVAIFFSWAAFAALLTASLYRLGLVPTIVLAGTPLIIGRLIPPTTRFQHLFKFKLGLSFAALILGIIALLGLVTLIEGVVLDG
jgi:hypothetical protein